MLNDEIRITNEEIESNGETPNLNASMLWEFVIVVSSFLVHSDFELRHFQ
jgi:hypothetical protein